MTSVIAYSTRGEVGLVGDRLVADMYFKKNLPHPKIRVVNDFFGVGVSGSLALLEEIMFGPLFDDFPNQPLHRSHITNLIIPAIMTNIGYASKTLTVFPEGEHEQSVSMSLGGQLIFVGWDDANKPVIYTVDDNGGVLQSSERFDAIGIGSQVALGALEVLSHYETELEVILQKAHYATENVTLSVGKSHDIITLERPS